MSVNHRAGVLVTLAAGLFVHASYADLVDGGFETQAALQNLPGYVPAGSTQTLGAGWNNWGWTSWQGVQAGGSWVGGALARTEEYAAGWKWAHGGNVFGIIKDRQTMSQTFTASQSGIGTLTWFDANRAAWRDIDWFGRPNDYSVTIADQFGNTQTIGNYTSVVAGGNSYSSPPGNGWWTTEGKSTWFAKSGTGFSLVAGTKYTLSFNSLSPYVYDSNGNLIKLDDRSTFLDDISMSIQAVPLPAAAWSGMATMAGLGGVAVVRRRRVG